MQIFRHFLAVLMIVCALVMSAHANSSCDSYLSSNLLKKSTAPSLPIKIVQVLENPLDPERPALPEDEAWIRSVLQKTHDLFASHFMMPPQFLQIHIMAGIGHTSYSLLENKMKLDQQDVFRRNKAVLMHEYGHSIFGARLFLLNNILLKNPMLALYVSAAYNEVFADLVGALACDDGACHYEAILNRNYSYQFDDVNSKERFARLRDMTKTHLIDEVVSVHMYTYGTKYLTEAINPHLLFTQARSHIWQSYVKHKAHFKEPVDFLNLVFKVFRDEIMSAFGRAVMKIKKSDESIESMNDELIRSFDKELGYYLKEKSK